MRFIDQSMRSFEFLPSALECFCVTKMTADLESGATRFVTAACPVHYLFTIETMVRDSASKPVDCYRRRQWVESSALSKFSSISRPDSVMISCHVQWTLRCGGALGNLMRIRLEEMYGVAGHG